MSENKRADIQAVCVATECKPAEGFSFSFGGKKFQCSYDGTGKIISDMSMTISPYHCKVPAKCYNLNVDVFFLSLILMPNVIIVLI